MSGPLTKVAVYTTIYPGVESYVAEWYKSLQDQTDQDYQLWIGLDGIELETVERAIGSELEATWIHSEPQDTPAQVRQRALARIVEACDAVVLVDSDDLLKKTRVAAACAALEKAELVGCALQLVDQQGQQLGVTFTLPPDKSADEVLPQHN